MPCLAPDIMRALDRIRFDLTSMRLFIAVVEHGSITRAAEQLCVAATAASRRIADLEEQFGLALFERRPHGVVLTEAGRSLLPHARTLMLAVEAMHSDAAAHALGDRGVVRISACTSAALQFLPRDLHGHQQAYPDIDIDLREMSSHDVVKSLAQGNADIGILESHVAVPSAGWESAVYRRDRLLVIAPRGHPLAQRQALGFDDLLPYAFVALAEGTASQALLQRETSRRGAQLRQRIRTRSFDTLTAMVRAGLGIGLMPEPAAQWLAADQGLVRVPVHEAWAERTFLLCHRPASEVSASTATLLEFLLPARNSHAGLPK
ncbi:LysR family transcriptional regulator [Verticiella sediminum]|uniref:LysR family transcriptional regulator n=1 Tax=Verticiella sediminum TaxID=1247510 RepID=A0A556B045_9BURK|nr:LysR family transcriptional regulator [Verticiella sediminum]TSH98544.1 LysR family transcriptional regulator [Verticiella sediminum]